MLSARLHLAALALALLPALPVGADTSSPVGLQEVVRRAAAEASVVCTGEVLEARAVSVDQGRKILTLVRLAPTTFFRGAGEAAPAELEIVLPGGDLGELGQRVGAVPRVEAGDRLLLFLRPRPGGARARLDLTLLGASIWRLRGEGAGAEAVLEPDAVRLATRPGEPRAEVGELRLTLAELPRLLEAEIGEGGRP
ncbi:MAG: hypothetical protein P1V51_18575 [Deltaproteobacteria bacterium]|nr:hypothetical protein [Deltaproteobacteria bacterium]